MNVKVFVNYLSKNFINTDDQFKDVLDNVFIQEWLEEPNVKLYLLSDDNNNIKTFVLLSKIGKDPLKKHTNPYYLNYIYTFENYRRQGCAYNLITELKKLENITVFSTDDIASNLFKKAEFICNSYDPLYKSFPIYRYP
jgi:hypothetical protein